MSKLTYGLAPPFVPVSNPTLDTVCACAASHLPPDAWFPLDTASADEWASAREVCDSCPLIRSCGEWARLTRQSGVWGGELLVRGKVPRGMTRRLASA